MRRRLSADDRRRRGRALRGAARRTLADCNDHRDGREHALRHARALPRERRDADQRRAVRRGHDAAQLAGYSRDHVPSDLYFDPNTDGGSPWIDLPGFSTAVESYEYSKQPMNNVALESGAGTSFVYGPIVNASNAGGAQAVANLATLVQHFAQGSAAAGRFVFPPNTFPSNPGALLGNRTSGDPNPKGTGKGTENPLGWPGMLPTTHPYRSFDPSIDPTSAVDLYCAISSDDDPGATGALSSADYECELHDAAPPRSRVADRAHGHAWRRRVQRVEIRPVGDELLAGDARRERGRRRDASPSRISRASARRTTS